jgi:hypothetical protein
MSKDLTPPSSSRPPSPDEDLAKVLERFEEKLDRVIGLCATAVTQTDRLGRIFASSAQLDARSKAAEVLSENRAVLSQVRDALTALNPRAIVLRREDGDEDDGSFSRRRRDDDSQITASVKLQIRNRDEEPAKKRSKKEIAWDIVKTVATLGLGWLASRFKGH